MIAAALSIPAAPLVAALVNVVVACEECTRVNTEFFSLKDAGLLLVSECQNDIRIIELTECAPGATDGEPSAEPLLMDPCTIGLTLSFGDSCALPTCPFN